MAKIIQMTDSDGNVFPKNAALQDISASCTYNLGFGVGYIRAYYDRSNNTVRVSFSIDNATSSRFGAGEATAPFTLPSGYRPSSTITGVPMLIRANDGVWHSAAGSVYTSGKIGQNMTTNCQAIYGTIEFTI